MGKFFPTVLSTVLLVTCIASSGFASEADLRTYLTIGEATVEEVVDTIGFDATFEAPPDAWVGDIGAVEIAVDKIINIGKKIWAIVEAGRPVVDVRRNTATALPQGITSWTQLAGWQKPASRLYRVSYKNGFGGNVIDFTYRVLYTYGGNVNGVGKYLTNVTVVPANLEVAWGYKFDAEVTIPSVVNAGTIKYPIGAAEILVAWKVNTAFKHAEGTESYYVKGDGTLEEL